MSPGPNYERAKREMFWANDYFGSGRFNEVESRVEKVAEMLADDHSDEAHQLKHEAKELGRKVQEAIVEQERKRIFDQAKREVFWANDNIQSGRFDEVPTRLEKAEQLIVNDYSPDAQALRGEINDLGNKVRAAVAARDQKRNYDKARREFMFASDNFNSGRGVDGVEEKLTSIESLIAYDQTPEGQALKAEIAALRQKIDDMVKPEDQNRVGGAKGKVTMARNWISQNYPNGGPIREGDVDYFETLFRQANEYLSQISDPRKAPGLSAPIVAEIEQIRTQYYPKPPAPSFPVPVPAAPAPAPPGPNFERAKRELFWAKEYFDSRRFDEVETRLNVAEPMLADDHSPDAAALKTEIKAYRDKLDAMVKPEDQNKVSAAQGKITQARNWIAQNYADNSRIREGDVDFFETLFRQANEYLAQIGDQRKAPALRAPIDAEIAQIRANYYPQAIAPPPPPPSAVAPVAAMREVSSAPPGPNYESAKRKVFWGSEYFQSNRMDQVEGEFKAAENLLQSDHSKEANDLRDQIAQIRDKVADTVSSVDQSRVNNAEAELRALRDWIDRLGTPTLDTAAKERANQRLNKAVELLNLVTPGARYGERVKAPVLKQIADIRAQWQIPAVIAPTPPPPTHASRPGQPCPTPRRSRTRTRTSSTGCGVTSRRTDGLENAFIDAQKLMDPLPMAYQEPFLAEIEGLRVLLQEVRQAEAARKFTGRLDRLLSMCQYVADNYQWDRFDSTVANFDEVFKMDEVQEGLGPKLIGEYEEKRKAMIMARAVQMKSTKLKAVEAPLRELQAMVESNPLEGVPEHSAYQVAGNFRSYKSRVESGLDGLPEEDEDVKRIRGIIADSDAKYAAYDNAWAKGVLHEQVKRTWEVVLIDQEDWQQETVRADARPLDTPPLPKTRMTIMRVRNYLHNDSSVQRTRNENKGDEVIAAIDAQAASVLEAAGSKLAAAYADMLDVGEALPTPTGADRFTRDRIGPLQGEVRTVFENTRWLASIMSRLTALDDKWSGDLDRLAKERAELGTKLTADGLAAWPGIVAQTGASTSRFDPGAAQAGQTFVLEGVYNRAGWDYDGNAYEFSMMCDGIVIAGLYEPYIKKALDHAAYELKLTIDDHKKWDLVGLVLGPGTVKQRQKTTIRNGMNSYEVEEWNPVACLRFRVVALRAGPVAVGPS
ncbi:hypothetical protein MSAN_00637100 [Mycena sanguinolenta]|uniref:Uncharacterized protein n=1 Tax=Mycena sanguinolenta TaxID=230812 RepID=A0A8H6Z566_9AGAR|nr:hypothetical protein MSAN_00637100 [Mycena sanguinolenta]